MSRQLLDSVNKVGEHLEHWRSLALQYDVERMDLLAENERLTQVAAEHRDGRLAALERAAAAEARYAALCEAEPVSWQDAANDDLRRSKMFSDDIALIHRPSMEGGK